MALDHDKLCGYFGVSKKTQITDEFPDDMLVKTRVIDHEGNIKYIPMPLFSISVRRVGGTLMHNCAIARAAIDQGYTILIGSRTAYVSWRLNGRKVIAKVAHTGRTIVIQNDKERSLKKPALIYFYPLTRGRTARGIAAGAGKRGKYAPEKKPRTQSTRRDMKRSLEMAMTS